MVKRRIFSLFSAVAMVLTLLGCSTGNSQPTDATNKFQTGDITPVEYGAVADIYVPETGIINPPTVVQQITAETGFPSRDRAPAVCVLEIDKEMNITDGSQTLTTVDIFLSLFRDRIIPAFYIDSAEEASALAAYLKSQNIIDAYVMADTTQAQLIQQVRDKRPQVQGALWFDSFGDEAACKDALLLARRSLASVICCRQPLTPEDTAYFNIRLMTVWSMAENTADIYRAVASGYNGVICQSTDTVFDVYKSITDCTVSGRSFPIGHRGVYNYLENTIASYRRAMEEYHCAAVEIDLRLCADGEIIMMHDTTLDRTTDGMGFLDQTSLETLKTLKVTSGGKGETDSVPTFEEVLQAFQNTDLVLVCHINVKSDTMINRFNELVERYNYQDRIIAFLHYNYITEYNYRNVVSGVGFASGSQDSFLRSANPLEIIENFVRGLNVFHYQPLFYDYIADASPDFNHANPEFYYQMSARGYLNWHSSTSGEKNTEQTLLTGNGCTAALLNQLSYATDFFYYVDANDLQLKTGDTIPTEQTAIGQTENKAVPCGYIQIGGDPLTGNTLQTAGTATVVYYADLTTPSGTAYRILSNPVTVTFA